MKYKILEEQNLEKMLNFTDDKNTKFKINDLKEYINNKNNIGFIAEIENKIIGFASTYILIKPDGRRVLYLDTIDIMKEYQNKGYGRGLVSYICDYAKKINCCKMYLITNKSNKAACICYEKAGGINNANDEIVYVYDLKK